MAVKAKITSTNSADHSTGICYNKAQGGTVTSVTAIGDLTNVTTSVLLDGAITICNCTQVNSYQVR